MRIKKFLNVVISIICVSAFTSCGSNDDDQLPIASGISNQNEAAEADAMLSQGRAYEAAKKNSKALSTYKAIFKQYPQTNSAAEAKYAQARILDQQGDLLKAFDAYQDVIARFPSSPHYAAAISRQETVAHAAANGVIQNSFLGMKTSIGPENIEKMLGNVRDNAPRAISAPKAQYAIARVWQRNGNANKAIAAYQRIALDYPNSGNAPEALYQQGEILTLKAKRGNQNTAHVDRAREIYSELIRLYPSHSRATDARKRLATLRVQDVQRSYETAEFYRKKGQSKAALFYYRELLRKVKSGSYHDLAKQRITDLGG